MTSPAVEQASLTLHTDDGVTLAARWHPAGDEGSAPRPAGAPAVVVVHGFAGSKEQPAVVAMASALAAGGHRVLVYDSRGHGGSGGACTLGAGERLDVDAAVRRALDGAERVVVVGASMGGIAVLNHLAAGGLRAVRSWHRRRRGGRCRATCTASCR